jgi:hypothetical protein
VADGFVADSHHHESRAPRPDAPRNRSSTRSSGPKREWESDSEMDDPTFRPASNKRARVESAHSSSSNESQQSNMSPAAVPELRSAPASNRGGRMEASTAPSLKEAMEDFERTSISFMANQQSYLGGLCSPAIRKFCFTRRG